MKVCRDCGIPKPLDDFNRHSGCKQGRRPECRKCQREWSHAHYEANAEKIKAEQRAAYAANPDPWKARAKAWRETNPVRDRELHRAWRAANRDYAIAARKAWRAANREREAAWARADYANNPERREKNRLREAAWAKANPDRARAKVLRRRARRRNAPGASYTTAKHIAARAAMYGDRCRYCPGPGIQVDHRIPLSRGGTHWPANLVPICPRCNRQKSAKTEFEYLAQLAA